MNDRNLSPDPPIELSTTDVLDVESLYRRCTDYFILQDGVAPALADAFELFTDVPSEKSPDDQAILGWKNEKELYAVAAILRDFPSPGTWYLGFLLVDAAIRSQGYGQRLYAAIEEYAASRGADVIRLAVLEENGAAERFWKRLGFGEIQRVGPDTFKTRSHRRIVFSRTVGGDAHLRD